MHKQIQNNTNYKTGSCGCQTFKVKIWWPDFRFYLLKLIVQERSILLTGVMLIYQPIGTPGSIFYSNNTLKTTKNQM